MYKCLECGHVFEEGEQAVWREAHGFSDGLYEEFCGCPHCKGEYEEAATCKNCGEVHTSNELHEGWCVDCLTNVLDYETFFEYCEAHAEDRYLDQFVMMYLLGGMDCPERVSREFHTLMRETYLDAVQLSRIYHESDDFIADCAAFVLDDDGDFGRDRFAHWLNGREVK